MHLKDRSYAANQRESTERGERYMRLRLHLLTVSLVIQSLAKLSRNQRKSMPQSTRQKRTHALASLYNYVGKNRFVKKKKGRRARIREFNTLIDGGIDNENSGVYSRIPKKTRMSKHFRHTRAASPCTRGHNAKVKCEHTIRRHFRTMGLVNAATKLLPSALDRK